MKKHWLSSLAFISLTAQLFNDISYIKETMDKITLTDILGIVINSLPYVLIIVLWYKYQKLKFDHFRLEIHSMMNHWLEIHRSKNIKELTENGGNIGGENFRATEKKLMEAKLRSQYAGRMSDERRKFIIDCYYTKERDFWSDNWPD